LFKGKFGGRIVPKLKQVDMTDMKQNRRGLQKYTNPLKLMTQLCPKRSVL
jgi:hypothetical protein